MSTTMAAEQEDDLRQTLNTLRQLKILHATGKTSAYDIERDTEEKFSANIHLSYNNSKTQHSHQPVFDGEVELKKRCSPCFYCWK